MLFSTQSRDRTCKHSGLSRVALPVGVPGRFEKVVLDGIEPSFPACKTGVVAVGPQDCVCRSGEHVPKDLNPDLLVWNQQCYRYTKDVFEVGTQGIAPLADYHTIKGRRVTTSRVETLPSCQSKLTFRRKPWDSNPQRFYPQLFSRQCPHPAG